MADLPSDIQYGKVVGRYILAIADTTADADRNPDPIYATGSIDFTPVSGSVTSTANPVADQYLATSVLPQKVTGSLVDGVLSDETGPSVMLIAGQYDVAFNFESGKQPGFRLTVVAGQTVDLTLAAPLVSTPAVRFVVNEQVYRDTLAQAERAEAEADRAEAAANGAAAGYTLPARLGALSKSIDGQNLSLVAMLDNGWYCGGNLVNAPNNDTGVWLVRAHRSYDSSAYGEQVATKLGLGANAAGPAYRRIAEGINAGVVSWSPWVQVNDSTGAVDNLLRNSLSATATANSTVKRDSNGQVVVPVTPTAAGHATSKQYTDAQVASRVQKGAQAIVYADIDPTIATAINNGASAFNLVGSKADLVGGKIPTSQIPAIALGETFIVASQAAMLALTAQNGDVAKRTDLSGASFLLTGGDSTVLANWLAIGNAGGAVTSVNSKVGAVVLGAADVAAVPTSVAGINQVFLKNAAGVVSALGYTPTATGNALAQRNAVGDLAVNTTPTNATDATSKAYVDGKTVTPSDTATVTTAIAIDPTGPRTLVRTLAASVALSISGTAPAGVSFTTELTLIQDATGGRQIFWPANILWSNSTPPVLSTAAGSIDVVRLRWDGVRWLGFPQGIAFGPAAVQTTKTVYTQTATSTLAPYATEGTVTMAGGVLTLTPAASAWAGGVKAFLATTDNANGSVSNGTPAAVADFTHTFDLEFADLGQQYFLYVIRARSRTYNGVVDDIWTSGAGAGNPKIGYYIQYSVQEGILSLWSAGTSTQIGSNISFPAPNRLMKVKVVVAGQSVQMRIWAQGASEPTTWALNMPTGVYDMSGGSVGFVMGNGPAATSKTAKISNQVMTTPIITAGASVAAPTTDPRAGFTRIYTENFTTDATTGTGASSVLVKYVNSLQLYDDAGVYYPRATTTVHDGYLDVNLPGDKGAAFVFGGTNIAYDRIGGRFAFRAMAIDAIGNGTATMVWPSSEVWADGEMDYPESNFEDMPMGHHHYMIVGQEGSSDNFGTGVGWRAWHEYAVEWFPPGTTLGGASGKVNYYVDNVLVATITTNVPTKAHRFMFQIGNYGQPGHFLVDYATMSSLN